jgi:hypothetical protein
VKRGHAPLLLLVIGAILAAPAASQVGSVTLSFSPPNPQAGGDITLTAAVSGGTGVITVTYRESSDCSNPDAGNLIGQSTTDPYSVTWQNVSAGSHGVKAVATDETADPPACDPATIVVDPPPQCDDNLDNDGDNLVDFPTDPGCSSLTDNDESDDPGPPPAPELSLSATGVSTHVSSTEDRVYVNTNPGGAGFYTVTATPNDPDVVSVRFPGFTDDTPPFAFRYQHDELAEGSWPVTSRKASGPPSAESFFVVDHDTTAPAEVSVTYLEPGGNDADGVIHLAVTNGSDSESGIDAASATLERQLGTVAPGPAGPTCTRSPTAPWLPTEATNTLAERECAVYRNSVSDNVGNTTTDTTVEAVWYDPRDVDPPGNVRNPRLRAADHRIVVRYWFPLDPDFAGVKIIRSIAGVAGSERLAFNGRARRFVDRSVFNGTRYVYKIASYDTIGNQPDPAVFMRGRPRSRFLLAPRDGATLRRPPLLDWRAHKRARFYNVKLLRDAGPGPAREVLSKFPRRSALQLHWRWRHKGRVQRFRAGTYYWYVWPRIGGHYGALMGWQRFVVPRG